MLTVHHSLTAQHACMQDAKRASSSSVCVVLKEALNSSTVFKGAMHAMPRETFVAPYHRLCFYQLLLLVDLHVVMGAVSCVHMMIDQT